MVASRTHFRNISQHTGTRSVSNLSTVPEHPDGLRPEGGTFFPFDTNFAHEPLVGGHLPELFIGIRSGIVAPPGTVKSYRMTESHSLLTEIPLRPNVSRGRTQNDGIDRGLAPEPFFFYSSRDIREPDLCLCETMTTYTAVKTVTTTTTHRDTTTEDRRRRRR